MPRARKEVLHDRKRNMLVGQFWNLRSPGQEKPPRRDICEFHPDLEPEDVDALFLAKEQELRKEFGLSREEITWSNLYSNYEDAEGVNLAPMTLRSYKSLIKRFIDMVGDHDVGHFNSMVNGKFVKTAQQKGLSSKYIVTIQKLLKTLLRWGHAQGQLDKLVSFRSLKISRQEKRIYTQVELDTMEKGIRDSGERYALRVFLVARYALLRRKEILHLRLSDIDNNYIHVKRDPITGRTPNHNDNERSVPLSPKLRKFFEEDGVFQEKLEDPKSYYCINRCHKKIYSVLNRFKPSDSEGLAVLHGIRSAGITKLLLETGKPELVAKFAGHTPKVMYQHYLSLKEANTDELADVL